MTYTPFHTLWEDSPDGVTPSPTPLTSQAVMYIEAGITAAAAQRLDQLAAPTSSVALNNQKITGLGTPTATTDAATKAYADAVATGLDIKLSVRAATTANITLSGAQTIDGVSVIAGDRVLVKNQTTGANNGIYVAASGAWARSTDADVSAEVTAGLITFVSEGTVNANQLWALATDDPITLGTTALSFTQFSSVAPSSGHTIEDEGTGLTARTSLNFVGAGVAAADTGGKTVVTIPGGAGADRDNSLTWRLNGAHSAGATTINLQSAPLAVGANLGFLIIDPYTIEAEIRKVTNITGTAVTVAATTYAHADGDTAMWWPGGLVPWSWWGAKPGNSSFASDNVTGFNRLSQQLYNLASFYYGGILVPPGVHYVDNELTPERDQILAGVNVLSSKIQAHTTFTFTGTERAIIHPKRDGVSCSFATAGVSARWILRDIFIDGNLVSGANGVMSSPQQPDGWNNVRVDKCPGYGIGLCDVQQHIMNNIEIDQCGQSLRMRDARFVWVDGFNSEHCTDTHVLLDSTSGGSGCFHNSFSNVHIEQSGSAATAVFTIDSTGSTGDSTGHLFDHVWITNSGTLTAFNFPDASTAAGYQIRNARLYGSPSLVTAIRDVNRGMTLNAFTEFNSRIYNYQASTSFFAGASSVYGAPSYVARGAGASEARISVSDSSSSFHTPTFYSKRASGNDTHMVCLDSAGTKVLELTYAGGIILGGGTELKKILSATATFDPASTIDGATWTTTVTVTGATVANSVARASHSSIVAAGWILSAAVTAANTVSVTAMNKTGSTVNLASGTLRVVVEQF